MNKSIVIDCLSTPDRLGYNDRGTVLLDNAVLWHESLRAGPNPYQPSTGLHYKEVYGQIAPCLTTWKCFISPKHGKCLILNGGMELPARYPNFNHGMKCIVDFVEVHCGETEDWSGSAACITLAPHEWPDFIKYFELGDTGDIAIIDKTTGGVA